MTRTLRTALLLLGAACLSGSAVAVASTGPPAEEQHPPGFVLGDYALVGEAPSYYAPAVFKVQLCSPTAAERAGQGTVQGDSSRSCVEPIFLEAVLSLTERCTGAQPQQRAQPYGMSEPSTSGGQVASTEHSRRKRVLRT
jgi:hypothetical protein